MDLGDSIRENRKRLGLTQAGLAKRVGVTPSFIAKIEKNQTVPSFDRLFSLADVLVLDREDLLSKAEKAKREHVEQRIRSQGSVVRGTYGLRSEQLHEPIANKLGNLRVRGVSEDEPLVTSPHSNNAAEHIGRQVLDDPDFQRAFAFVREILSDPDLKPVALKTLEALAQLAKS